MKYKCINKTMCILLYMCKFPFVRLRRTYNSTEYKPTFLPSPYSSQSPLPPSHQQQHDTVLNSWGFLPNSLGKDYFNIANTNLVAFTNYLSFLPALAPPAVCKVVFLSTPSFLSTWTYTSPTETLGGVRVSITYERAVRKLLNNISFESSSTSFSHFELTDL